MAQSMVLPTWEHQLHAHLTSHEQNERAMLEEYRDVASSSESKAFRYLSSLILEDEIRHHRLFGELALALKSETEPGGVEPEIPRLDKLGVDALKVVEVSEKLLQQERDDAKALHDLASELKRVDDVTLWQLLVRLMEMDTAKHIEILKFVRRYAHVFR